MPNYQARLYDPPRTVVLEWTKYSKDRSRVRQYALWTSGQIITRIGFSERRLGLWEDRATMRFTKANIKRLDQLLRAAGYQREFRASSANFVVSRRVGSLG